MLLFVAPLLAVGMPVQLLDAQDALALGVCVSAIGAGTLLSRAMTPRPLRRRVPGSTPAAVVLARLPPTPFRPAAASFGGLLSGPINPSTTTVLPERGENGQRGRILGAALGWPSPPHPSGPSRPGLR